MTFITSPDHEVFASAFHHFLDFFLPFVSIEPHLYDLNQHQTFSVRFDELSKARHETVRFRTHIKIIAGSVIKQRRTYPMGAGDGFFEVIISPHENVAVHCTGEGWLVRSAGQAEHCLHIAGLPEYSTFRRQWVAAQRPKLCKDKRAVNAKIFVELNCFGVNFLSYCLNTFEIKVATSRKSTLSNLHTRKNHVKTCKRSFNIAIKRAFEVHESWQNDKIFF